MIHNSEELLENEWFIVRHSGETPEIAYNSAIYFLTRAKDGPGLELTSDQLTCLKKGAMLRSREIILRDLQHSNVNKSIYRGISRSITNYQRYKKFCERQSIEDTTIKEETAQALTRFLANELDEMAEGKRGSVINCSFAEVLSFANELGVEIESAKDALREHCQ